MKFNVNNMKSLKLRLLFEANAKRPSGLGKIKDKSEEKDVEFIAGDIYDLGDHNRYTEKFKYYKGDGNGYIMDKEGNYYDVVTSTWSSDTGRIAGGTMNYSVVIKNVNGQNLSFSGYSAIFSSPSHATIVIDIENGMYLEDFIAKHWGALGYSVKETDELKKLKEKGNPNAKTYKAEKEENKAQKVRDFFERYLVLPDNISFEIKNDDLEFNWQPVKRKEEDKPKTSSWALRRQDFETEEAYNDAKASLDKQWEEYSAKYKQLDKQIIDIFKPFCVNKLKELFKTDIKNLNGLIFGVKPKDKEYRDSTALDTKDKKLVVLHDYSKDFNKNNWKLNKEVVGDIVFYPTAKLDKRNPSEYLKDLFKRASDAYQKLNGRSKGKYVDAHWHEYYDWYGAQRNSSRYTSNKKQAREWAERDFFKDLADHRFENETTWQISFEVAFLKDLIKGDLSVDEKPEAVEKKEAEKKEAPKFTGKLAEQEKKMDAWHNGTRKQNVEACSDAKLKVNYDICKQKGYDKEAELLKKEADARGLTLESLSLENMKLTLQDFIDLI